MKTEIDFEKLMDTVPILRGYPEDDVRRLIAISDLFLGNEGMPIYQQGQPPKGMYLVVRGTVELRKKLGSKSPVIYEAGSGDVLGGNAYLENTNHSENAVTTQTSLLLFVAGDFFTTLLSSKDPAALLFLGILGDSLDRQLRQTKTRIQKIFLSVGRRILQHT